MTKSLFMVLCSSLVIQSSLAANPASADPVSHKNAFVSSSSPDRAGSSSFNPLFEVSTLPYELPPFDKIQDGHFAPAFAEAMRQHSAEIKVISENPANPSFDNTVQAMERAGQMLGRVSSIFFNLSSTDTNPVLQALSRDLAPRLAAHRDNIHLNAALFERIHTVYALRENLAMDPESRRLLERYYTDFVRAGAILSDTDKKSLKSLNAQLATLGTRFSQNVLGETNLSAVTVDTRVELDGLSGNEIKTAADAAKARGLDGKYLITLKNTTGQPLLARLTDRALRKRLYETSAGRSLHGGQFDNREIVLNIVKLRAERARLLGYANHAAYILEDGTAKTTAAVNKMLSDLSPAALANARQEALEMQKLITAQNETFTLEAWDSAYYGEQVRKAKYNFDESQLRPYFELNHVLIDGVFFAANKLYGISFRERKDLPTYHPSVRIFEVYDADGRHMALFLADMYARPSKRGGAWMNSYVQQSGLLGLRPVVANHLNILSPPEGQPTLLTYDEVRTAFHEFGHALHGIFSNVQYPRFSGTSVPRDFVEYPSQVNEMWAVWPEVLQNYARHYQTGEAMPAELLAKLAASAKFNQGIATTEYLAAAVLDQRWHQLKANQLPADVVEFETMAIKQAGLDFSPAPPRYRSGYFSHIFSGGYAAGYYAYLWSEVLDADTVDWFKENGGLTRQNGNWFRQQLLSLGGSIDAMDAFLHFRGRPAQIDPLLLRRGLKTSDK